MDSDRGGRIVGGHGTQRRPWMIEDESSSAEPSRARDLRAKRLSNRQHFTAHDAAVENYLLRSRQKKNNERSTDASVLGSVSGGSVRTNTTRPYANSTDYRTGSHNRVRDEISSVRTVASGFRPSSSVQPNDDRSRRKEPVTRRSSFNRIVDSNDPHSVQSRTRESHFQPDRSKYSTEPWKPGPQAECLQEEEDTTTKQQPSRPRPRPADRATINPHHITNRSAYLNVTDRPHLAYSGTWQANEIPQQRKLSSYRDQLRVQNPPPPPPPPPLRPQKAPVVVAPPVEELKSGSQIVDNYLAQRQMQKQKAATIHRLGRKGNSEQQSAPFGTPDNVSSNDAYGVREYDDDDDDDESEPSSEALSGDDEGSDHDTPPDRNSYSMKVCVISAVDLPASVVPNLPLSPFIKICFQDQGSKRVRTTSSKILSKRDNGAVEFQEELRWNNIHNPEHLSLAIELSSRAILPPANIRESPPPQKIGPFSFPNNHRSAPSPASGTAASSLFRKIRKSDSAEMEEANAAAAVAKLLVEGEDTQQQPPKKLASQNELDVKLRTRKRRRQRTDSLLLGSKEIPLSVLPLEKLLEGKSSARLEQWFQLDTSIKSTPTSLTGTSPSASTAARNPSVLLEISFSPCHKMDESEDENDLDVDERKASYSKRASLKIRKQLKQEFKPDEEKVEEPLLEPGIIDYVCIVGARDIGSQKADDGARGWVNSTPECALLEQFPADDSLHTRTERSAVFPDKFEWFCFPEGCRLWRGLTPPNPDELNLKRFSGASPCVVSSSVASFDACLSCTASFSWFVLSSSSEEYGSETKKTYGAVIRFFVPAPTGVDPTQDDFAQHGGTPKGKRGSEAVRLWVPIGICMTSRLPIVGVMEVALLRLCESLSGDGIYPVDSPMTSKQIFHELAGMVVSYQRPISGVVNCSIPFLGGDRLHIALPPPKGLPPLPHGNAVTSTCRLLGADGLNYLLAAFLSECKILLHSDDVANLCMVAEVMTALLYPFQWSLPYIPVLPLEMMEIVEAPVSFLLGVPSCNVRMIDPSILEDIVLVDLDRDFSSSDYSEAKKTTTGLKSKSPVPLPASVASNISKAVYKLLRSQESSESTAGVFSGARSFPMIEKETSVEREFRVTVAMEVCSLLRGFDDCLVYSASQPIFNVDKYLQMAPIIFEEQRGAPNAPGRGHQPFRKVVSPRSRRFVSILVCCQHFHQFLEALDHDSLAFFHAIMRSLNSKSNPASSTLAGRLLSLNSNQTVEELANSLLNAEYKIPVFRVREYSRKWEDLTTDLPDVEKGSFPLRVLDKIFVQGTSDKSEEGAGGVKSVSLEYLVELEKSPWRYTPLFPFEKDFDDDALRKVIDKVKIREAIGDRRYRVWKSSANMFDGDESSLFSEESRGPPTLLDLSNLLSNVTDGRTATGKLSNECEAVKLCLKAADVSSGQGTDSALENTEALVIEAESALEQSSAQRFLLMLLKERHRSNQGNKQDLTPSKRRLNSTGSKLDSDAFHVLLRLCFAMLNACEVTGDFESAYILLKLSAGIHSSKKEADGEVSTSYLTERLGIHPIYSNLSIWQQVRARHFRAQEKTRGADRSGDVDALEEEDNYEAVVTTLYEMNGYGIPAEFLARFASQMCETYNWYNSERGQMLLMLAKRSAAKRDQMIAATAPTKMSDIEMMSPSAIKGSRVGIPSKATNVSLVPSKTPTWVETGWCHPAAQSSRRLGALANGRRGVTQNLQQKFEETAPATDKEGRKYMKRSAITSMAYLGSSVIVTGGLDGGVFMARQVFSPSASKQESKVDVRGIHLDWGSSGSRYAVGSAATSLDGEYGVGAVTCLAATRSSLKVAKNSSKDHVCATGDEELLESMDGCRVVAGTTCGDLRVWSVKDVFSAVFYANGGDLDVLSPEKTSRYHSSGTASTTLTERHRRATDFAAGSSLTRLKFSLRGRALSGHRGGVSCIDVHSNVYRPDSVVTGGADGLIKLWSLRAPGAAGSRRSSLEAATTGRMIKTASPDSKGSRSAASKTGDALSILSGHGGRVLCVQSAWHGDRLLSGGADRTVRIWDLGGTSGKCLRSLSGHLGWVTSVNFWGPNTIISASTDRCVGLWDARVGDFPLFTLRHHCAPISNVLVAPRDDPVMISAASDGTIAAWDFRLLGSSSGVPTIAKGGNQTSRIVRSPSRAASMYGSRGIMGPLFISRGSSRTRKSVMCVGSDSVLREWDYETGDILNEHRTGHCDSISSLASLGTDRIIDGQLENQGVDAVTSTLTASWDGTIRMRTLGFE